MNKSAASKVIIFMILCLTLLLGGCGNGGSSEATTPGSTPTVSTVVSGTVVDGFIRDAIVRAYQISANGTKGAQIGSPTTAGAAGAYSLSLGSYTGPVLIESSGGSFTDWATGATVTLAAADIMKAVVANATGSVTAQITPLTNMAAVRAQQDIAVNGTAAATAIDNANTTISQYFGGFNIITDKPIDPTAAGSATGVSQASVDYAMVLAGISKNAGANAWDPFSLVTAMALDASDGAFDGKQGAAQVTVTTPAGGSANLPATAGKADMGTAIAAFQGSAQNASGGTATPQIITTLNATTGTYSTQPDPPKGLTATAISSKQIDLSWLASAGATGYNIYRGGTLLRSVTVLAISDTGLTPDTQYCYVVSATDVAGNESNKSSQVCLLTASVAAPPVPTGLTVTTASQSQANLAWTAGAGAAPAGYKIYKNGTLLKSVTTTTSTDTGLTASTQYCYVISSFDSTGNESNQTIPVCATTLPPPPPIPPPVPTGLSATVVSQSQVDLTWTASAGAASYKISRGGADLNSTSTAAYSDAGLAASTQYCYTVAAVDSSGNASAQSSQVCATTLLPPPPTPSGLAAVTASTSQIDLSWTASAGAVGYKVYRGGTFLKLAAATNASDTSLQSGKQYCYQVTAYGAMGSESAPGLQSCATTTALPTPGNFAISAVSASRIDLSWTVSAGAAGYKIYKGGPFLKSVGGTATSDTGLSAANQYCYTISAYDSVGNESIQASQLCATTLGPPPADPGNLTTFVELPGKVILSWSASVGATGYYIYRNGTNLNPLAAVTGTTYTDALATSNGQNIYRVTAIDATGSESSGLLNQVTVNTALTVPTMSSATANTSTQITIGWTNAGAGTGVAGYKIYRNGTAVQTIPSAATLTYADSTGLSASTQYCYRVSAIDVSSPAKESAQSSASFCATTYAATGSIALSLTKSSDGTATTSVSVDSPAVLTVTVTDGAGSAIPGAVVSFSTISDLSFNPASGTALAAADGKASITVNAGNTTGATTIRAAAADPSGTAISGTINLSVAPPNLSLSALTIIPAVLSAGGSAGVSVTVNDGSGNPFTTSVPISFTSDGAKASKATITSQVYTVNGVASATYRDINYASVDTITATLSIGGTTFTKTGTITVNAASAGSISFVSATPANIALKGTGGAGRSETSVVVFKVMDTNGNPISKKVNFSLNTTVGGLSLTTASANSDPGSGLVQTIVQSGTVSTPVRVSATIDLTTISTTSDLLVISTGIPHQNSFSIAPSTLNMEGWSVDGETSEIGVRLADHYNNPVPDGTAVYFRSSGGSIQPSCTTTNGACKVTFTSQAPRPANGRVRILAYALGEESFVDLNGNGIYDTIVPDTFTDMPEPFLDANENGVRDAAEEFVDSNANGSYSPGDGLFNGILRDAAIVGPTTIHVRNSSTVVLSGSEAVIAINTLADTITPCTTAAPFTPGSISFNVVITDVNGQVMPAGTTVSFSTTNGTIMTTPVTYVVPNTTTTSPPTYPVTIQSDATQSGASAPYTCTNAKPDGIFTVAVKTPLGVSSYGYATIND